MQKNQNVFFTNSLPRISVKKSYIPSTSHSAKFCKPLGTIWMFRVASWAKMISPSATIHVMTVELVNWSGPRLNTGASGGNP